MWNSIKNVIFAFMAVCCGLIGVFWLWFMYEYSLRWLDESGNVVPNVETAVAFGREGAEWIGLVAVGWFILAILFGLIQWRVSRSTTAVKTTP